MSRKPKIPAQSQPTKAEFMEYAREWNENFHKGQNQGPEIDPKVAADQWEIWDAGEWCDGDGTAILRWKLKLVTFAKAKYGVFGKRPDRRRRQASQEGDELEKIRKAARESEALNRKYQQRYEQRSDKDQRD
jgi:hypothetical protein